MKAKKSPNFFLMFLVGTVVEELVTDVGGRVVGEVERGRTPVDVRGASVDGTEGVKMMVMFSDEEHNRVEADGV